MRLPHPINVGLGILVATTALLGGAALGTFADAIADQSITATTADLTPPCQPGAAIAVWYWQSTPCDLDGSQTLYEYGLDAFQCEQRGGRLIITAYPAGPACPTDY